MGKDNTSANAKDRIPRVHDKYDPNGNIAPRGENEQHYKGLSEGTGRKISYGEGVSEFDRETCLMHVSSSASALTLSSLANAERSGLVEKSKLRESGSFGPTKQGGDKLVDRFVKADEWQKFTNEKGRHRSNERCIQQGLGGPGRGFQRTEGFWKSEEKDWHINAKELKAGLMGIKTFTREVREAHIALNMDNMTAIAQINKKFSPTSRCLLGLTREIWEFCMERENTVTAVYLPGKQNHLADSLSRDWQDSSDWKLDETFFQRDLEMMGPLEVDLFASRTNAQMEKYVSWKQDPEAKAVDSFQMSWKTVKGYAFPPFCLIGRCYRRSGGRKQLNVDSTSLASSDVVFDVTSTLNSGTGFVAANKEVATESEGRTPSVGPANDLEIGGMESVRQRATKEGFSEESTDSLMANWREGTKVSYQSAWGKWSSWCRGRGINPFQLYQI